MKALKDILATLNTASKEGYSEEELLTITMQVLLEDASDEFDLTRHQSLFSELLAYQRIESNHTEKEKRQIFEDTLGQFDGTSGLDERMLRDHLYMLTDHDKPILVEGIVLFPSLSLLLDSVVTHTDAINRYRSSQKSDSMIRRGVSASTSTTTKAIVNRRKNALEDITELTPHDKTVRNSLGIIDKFIEDPYAINIALNQTAMLFSADETPGLTGEEYLTVKAMGEYLDCDKPIKKVSVFYESLAATIAMMYGNKTLYPDMMKTSRISNEKLSDITTVIIRYLFETDYSIDAKSIARPIQSRCFYGQTLQLLEFQTPADVKVHPAFEENSDNQQFWSEISVALQGRFPPKRS